MRFFLLLCCFLLLAGCSAGSAVEPAQPQENSKEFDIFTPPSIPDLASGKESPPSPEDFKVQMKQGGERWLYGHGVGKTAANVGAVVLFPPYAIYLLGNAGLTLAGQEPVSITDVLPERPRRAVGGAYDSVTSVPGRLFSVFAGREFVESADKDDK